jgi:transcription elongation factor Elf1
MPDLSALDKKYFIDASVFNCPFCNRRNVAYSLFRPDSFDWTEDKKCYIYRVLCHSCQQISMHLSFEEIKVTQKWGMASGYVFEITEDVDLDSKFFYSVPTSFFVLDERIPKVLRELITEAEGCLKSNFLTGASACTRKVVYELAIIEKADGNDYESRLKSLKAKRSDVDGEYFDTLLTIQQVTSNKVHELSYDKWNSSHLRIILTALTEILYAMYVIPSVRQEKRSAILRLKEEVLGQRKKDGA